MTRDELKKIIVREFDAFAIQNGFTKRNDSLWFRIDGNIYSSIGFQKVSDGYTAAWCVYPLWEYCEVMHISYGSNILFRTGFFSNVRYTLSVYLTARQIYKGIRNIKRIFLTSVIPVLSAVTDAVSLRNAVNGSLLFRIGDFRKRLLAYCDAYNGDYENAVRLFEEYISHSGNPDNYKEEANLVCIMKNTPDKVKEYLQSNIDKMVKQEKLIDYTEE